VGEILKRKADLDSSFFSESSGTSGFSPTWTATKRRFLLKATINILFKTNLYRYFIENASFFYVFFL
jgi:hypothetical protein